MEDEQDRAFAEQELNEAPKRSAAEELKKGFAGEQNPYTVQGEDAEYTAQQPPDDVQLPTLNDQPKKP
jgi:hypothetical protein